MIARRCKSDGREQILEEHCRNVSELCFKAAEKLQLGSLAKLIGLLHDFGKGTESFQNYLHEIGDSHPHHAVGGALYARAQWWTAGKNKEADETAQLISLCIYGHHAGLPDCLNASGESPYLYGLELEPIEDYIEAKRTFYEEVASAEELNRLFSDACEELNAFGAKKSFQMGMTARLLLSILVDADRLDAYCFEFQLNPFEINREEKRDWEILLKRLEDYMEKLPREGQIAEIRREISEHCKKAGEHDPGIYTLSVPTGGGKTFSSLRFALEQAEKNGQERIFYFIPMNTIIDQNAEDIRKALEEDSIILEHHSNIVYETEEEENQYRKLTERWGAQIILSSLVQFLETLFRNGNGRVRRMWRLTNAVLIFDEIQVLPKKCQVLFKQAIRFLVNECNCTVLLCTATQPELGVKSIEVMQNVDTLYKKLQRVIYGPQLEGRSYEKACADIIEFIKQSQSVLTIVNTKEAAWRIFQGIKEKLSIYEYQTVEIQENLSDEEIRKCAKESREGEILCLHLSTGMCPRHRKEILRWMIIWLCEKKQVFCVSTALIEAGINVSFPVVVRSLAGIPSMIQAAGRCNRNCEAERGRVYLWNLTEEKLGWLPDIKKGRDITMNLLSRKELPEDIGSPDMIRAYYAKERIYTESKQNYPYSDWNSDLVTMLSSNLQCRVAAGERGEDPAQQMSGRLCQSFRTAGSVFRVIEEETRSVIVPYAAGKELIEKLSSRHNAEEEIRYLKEAQQYSVNLYSMVYERLVKEHAIYSLGETGAAALKEEFYDVQLGVIMIPKEMEMLVW